MGSKKCVEYTAEGWNVMLKDGLYEKVVSDSLAEELAALPHKYKELVQIDKAEAAKILAQYVAAIVERGLKAVRMHSEDIASQLALVNEIIATVQEKTQEQDFSAMKVDPAGQQLLALYDRQNSILSLGTKGRETVDRPETSLAQSSLFTGAVHEPQMYTELKKEIASCNRMDMLVSFIKWSGLRLLIEALKHFTQNGGRLRIITTSYMGATDVKAIKELSKLVNTEIKVSYDTQRTRLHAKAYVFYRDTGYTTAYIGSSNLSRAAMSSGLEWNIKITAQDQPETLAKIGATFASYWESREFEPYTAAEEMRLYRALRDEKYYKEGNTTRYTLDVRPYSYQQEILDKLAAERSVRGIYRNLIVAATGTGKTVIAAFDYARFCRENPGRSNRLLFVAHRQEILTQGLATFQAVLKDNNFGELFVGQYTPQALDQLFISIQTFNSQDFTAKTSPDFYDFIVVDEIHHGPADSYQKLLNYYQPRILLGLTATPERLDGKSILPYFGERIAAEIRLPEAIERKLLCPFQYFGVTDNVDLTEVKWTAGGYDKQALSNVYSLSGKVAERRADLIVNSLQRYVTDVLLVKGLGFCVSVEHASFMSDYFNQLGIPSLCLTGQSAQVDRDNARKRLAQGELKFIFVVDIYNEGVDIPEINTVLFLRPTESLTIFLQQLGRGLRLSPDKDCLTVLDFIGQANKKYSFTHKFAALLANTSHSVQQEVENGFVSAPKGCYIQLEKQAAQYILDNIKGAYDTLRGMAGHIASFAEDSGLPVTLANFLHYHHMDPRQLYRHKSWQSFSRMCVRAGVQEDYEPESLELQVNLSIVFQKLAVADSQRWIKFLLNILPQLADMDFNWLSPLESRMLQMFYVTIWGEYARDWRDEKVRENFLALANSPHIVAEMQELLRYQLDGIDFVDEPLNIGFACPLDLHCTYTRDQILVAMDFDKPNTVREGVKWLADKKTDLFFVTLNKADREYSPTTMYDDYSLNEWLFHWQSQSVTTVGSVTGQRYLHHQEQGTQILLFVREFKKDNMTGGAAAYTYLGRANYVSHEGEKPINIVWKLDKPIPAKFLKKSNKLAVG
ncbi:MAG: DUF3427 domain-containing protein [Selenomonas sp.]|uniref:DUF3427 domain-containing protein n=1 Tax=Selenomonas sp. TaxID=2053611 RepID=UPI0025DD9164|nr:DEAD/DEAH box helicase [Selenomonas sp.]MCR5756706.1 DUF3427 domain-containing protein [Selenomonas sp.]